MIFTSEVLQTPLSHTLLELYQVRGRAGKTVDVQINVIDSFSTTLEVSAGETVRSPGSVTKQKSKISSITIFTMYTMK